MKIKYTSCDGITEVEEEIVKAEFYTWERTDGKEFPQLECERKPDSPYYDEHKYFTVDFDRVEYIKE